MGHRIHCGPFIFQSRVTPGSGAPRLGVIASRRVGNAVQRNYGKRIFRECFRRHAAELPDGSETVVVLRSGFEGHSFEDLEARFLRACRTIGKMHAVGELKSPD
jgi:ribonuclease P protein component